MKKHIVLIAEAMSAQGLEFLKSKGFEVRIGRGRDKATLIDDLQGCDAVIVRIARIDAEVLARCPELKVVSKHGVGVDNIDMEAAKAHGVRVVYTPLANGLSVAEHAMALILALAKRLPYKASEYKKGNFAIKDVGLGEEISGKTLGLLGAGRVGRHLAKMAKYGHDMRVLAYDPYLKPDSFPYLLELCSHEDVLSKSDFVSIHLPATPETARSISTQAFQTMKKSAYLINTARGQVVDEAALIKALNAGEIAGAALDVNDPEPATPENPLFHLPNVILTPHMAASTVEAGDKMALDAARGVWEILSGNEATYPYPGY
jgi:D-3-phosphoglycerate dehydrogenase